MPKTSEKTKDIQSEIGANNLKMVLKYRGMTLADLADDLGMSYRTLKSYVYGERSLEDAKAKTVMTIADYLDVDPFILLGMKPLDGFYQSAKNREELAERLLTVEPWRRKKRSESTFIYTTEDGEIIEEHS